jgi:hypothetical protein
MANGFGKLNEILFSLFKGKSLQMQELSEKIG